jgi:general secretion pathway protein A
MYESYYGLTERPFDLTPNPRFLFMTAGHQEALTTIQYAISGRKGLTLLLGPAGTGKTTLVHAAIQQQQGDKARTVYLGNPTLTREEFYEFLAHELGLSPGAAASKAQFLRELRADLARTHAAGIVTALIIDEAQSMSDGLFEELRLLENLETPSQKLMPVVLVGQPELGTRLREPVLTPLRQRVALRATLQPLSHADAAAYIADRIRTAGGDIARVFTPEAVRAISESSGGTPRIISVLCDNALVNGFALDQRPIGPGVVAEVARDFDLPGPRTSALAAPAAALRPAGLAVTQASSLPLAQATSLPTAPQTSLHLAPVRERSVLARVPAAQMTNVQIPDTPPPVESLMMPHQSSPRAASGAKRSDSPVNRVRSLFSWATR